MGHIFLDMGNMGLERSAVIVSVCVSAYADSHASCVMGQKITVYKVKG